jgi:hypothetical protein
MAKIPLNFFRRVGYALSATPQLIYEVPFDRASILLTVLATNISPNIQTVTVSVSTSKSDNGDAYIDLIKDFQIGGNDAANITIGKVVIVEGDQVYAHCSSLTSVNLNLSILEAVNTR